MGESIEIGPEPEIYDRAVEMHLNTMFVGVSLGNNPYSWQAAYRPLLDRGLKVIAIPGFLVYDHRMYVESEMRPFLNWLRDNPVYKNTTVAIWPIDEPYWTNGEDIDGDGETGYSHENLVRLYNFIHAESEGVPVHYDFDPFFWVEEGRRIEGIADYLAWYVNDKDGKVNALPPPR